MGSSGGSKYGNFGGYNFTNPLVYENGDFRVQRTWNEVNSYGSKKGAIKGSTYFNFIEIGQRFDSRGSSFSKSSGNINNANPMLFDGYNDWHVPTQNALKTLIGAGSYGIARNGSTVNGNAKKHYSRIKTNITYAGQSNMGGYLFFPDDEVITGKALSAFDSTTQAASGVTGDELNEYLNQGCLFLPFSGYCYNDDWSSIDSYGCYWSATQRDSSWAYSLRFTVSSLNLGNDNGKSHLYFPVVLVRTI